MSVDFKTFNHVVKFVMDIKKPVLLRGRHGVGKSEVVYQIAEKLGLPVVERRASQMTEGDLVGLPVINDNRTSFNPPDWFKDACEQPVVLFLDEVDRAIPEVRQGIFELTDSRKLNGHYLHPDTYVFAAINGGEHGAEYQVGEMDPAELDRWTVFDLEPTVEDWLEWAKDRINPIIWDFINQNHNHLEHLDSFEPNKVYPSRRSWHRLDTCLQSAHLLEEQVSQSGFGLNDIYVLSCAFIGMEAAVSFRDFVQNYQFQVTPEEVLDEGKIEKVKNFMLNDHISLIEKMDMKGYLTRKMSDEQLKNLAAYIVVLPNEAGMLMWKYLGDCGDNVINLFSVDKNNAVKEYIQTLYCSDKDEENKLEEKTEEVDEGCAKLIINGKTVRKWVC
ncbi:MAG: MoxR family ATPase [Candidatus Bathyarchaeota archaeon]|nr:MoxR family ATPase [Candidatus Bathyarchaeota archaeon]